MQELIDHIRRGVMHYYRQDELNEIILGSYTIIQSIARDDADELQLTAAAFVWRKAGVVIGDFSIAEIKPTTMSFRDALNLIWQRDEVVQRHLHLLVDTQDEMVFRLV